jgi:hypothetical protein
MKRVGWEEVGREIKRDEERYEEENKRNGIKG